MKVATYNICHCENYENWGKVEPLPVNLARTAEIIAKINADIIGLNEVYTVGESEELCRQDEKLATLADYPYHAFAIGKEFGYLTIGNAILSKYPIINVKSIPVPAPAESERNPNETNWYEDRVVLCVEVERDGERFCVISTHFGLNPTEQHRIVNAVCKEIDTREKVVLMGDFNVKPDDKILSPLYARLHSVAKEQGNNEYTFATYEPKIQIDYIFVSKTAKIKDYTVHKYCVSDHRPISATIEF